MKLSYYIIYPLSCLVGWMPYKIQFLLSDIIRWVLYYVVHYRLKVVRENLRNAFPDATNEELKGIEKRFYNHLADVFLEIISIASVSEANIKRRIEFTNLEEIEQQTQGVSWICAMAHYGSWEYTASYGLHSKHEEVLGVYRPLSEKGFDKYFHKVRSRLGSRTVAMDDIIREAIKCKQQQHHVAIALIADQTPPRNKLQPWFDFLNQKTQFFMGTEKMATKFGFPVAFLHIDKVKRGYYKARFEIIYDGKEKVDEYEITRRYVVKLEQMIKDRPELWMWSHRRWKHKYEE